MNAKNVGAKCHKVRRMDLGKFNGSVATVEISKRNNKARPKAPRNSKGQILTRNCRNPECSGTMQYQGSIYGKAHWSCDGLIELPNGALDACPETHIDYDELYD